MRHREYVMYYRGPGFLPFVCFWSLPLLPPLSRQQVVSLSQSLWGEGAKSYYWRESLVLYNPMTSVLSAWSQINNQRAHIRNIWRISKESRNDIHYSITRNKVVISRNPDFTRVSHIPDGTKRHRTKLCI